MSVYVDDMRDFTDDPRVMVERPGVYVVERNGFRLRVMATRNLAWVVVPADGSPGSVVSGFADADGAIRFILDSAPTPVAA